MNYSGLWRREVGGGRRRGHLRGLPLSPLHRRGIEVRGVFPPSPQPWRLAGLRGSPGASSSVDHGRVLLLPRLCLLRPSGRERRARPRDSGQRGAKGSGSEKPGGALPDGREHHASAPGLVPPKPVAFLDARDTSRRLGFSRCWVFQFRTDFSPTVSCTSNPGFVGLRLWKRVRGPIFFIVCCHSTASPRGHASHSAFPHDLAATEIYSISKLLPASYFQHLLRSHCSESPPPPLKYMSSFSVGLLIVTVIDCNYILA